MSILVLTQTGGILRPFAVVLGLIMNYIYRFQQMLGIDNIALTIILFTLIVNVIMIPLTIKQQKFTKMSALVNPEIQKIQKKYEGRKDEKSMRMQQAETQAVYDKYGASPAGGCLPILIQMPILFSLYRVIYNVPAYVEPIKEIYMKIAEPIMQTSGYDGMMTKLISELSLRVTGFDGSIEKVIDALYLVPSTQWAHVSDVFASNPAVVDAVNTVSSEIIRINTFLGGMSLSDAPLNLQGGIQGLFPGVLIPLLAGGSQWINMQIMQRNQPKQDPNSQMSATMNSMNAMMPIMSMFFCATLPLAIGIYWICSAVFRTIITVFIDKVFLTQSVEEIIEANKEKAAKKAEKRGEQQAQLEKYAAMKTSTMDMKSISQLAKASVEGKGENAKSAPSDVKRGNNSGKKSQNGKKSISSYANMMNKRDN